jgi:hypothetical protein
MSSTKVLGLLVMVTGLIHTGISGGKDSLAAREDFRPGDTLRYTTDGSAPDRTSRFVLVGANEVVVTKTTTFKARLYRPGCIPSRVQSHTVYVRDSAKPGQLAAGKNLSPPSSSLQQAPDIPGVHKPSPLR